MHNITKTLALPLFSLLAFALPACDVEDLDDPGVREQLPAVDEDAPEIEDAGADDEADATMLGEGQGGAPDELADPVDPAAAYCTGYWNGGNYCLARCADNPGLWRVVGHLSQISYGHCTSAGDQLCSWGHGGRIDSCWGWP